MPAPALIVLAAFGIALLLVLVVGLRLHAFLALLLTSLIVAVLGGVPLAEIADLIQKQMGSTLGYIAVVIGLGAMFGEMLQRSGGASRIADKLLKIFGEKRAPWALSLTGLIDRTPLQNGGNQAWKLLGINGFAASVSAYFGALVSGEGDWIDVSAQECAAGILEYHGPRSAVDGTFRLPLARSVHRDSRGRGRSRQHRH